MHRCIPTFLHTCMHTYIHCYMSSYMHAYVHTYIRTCIHVNISMDIYMYNYLCILMYTRGIYTYVLVQLCMYIPVLCTCVFRLSKNCLRANIYLGAYTNKQVVHQAYLDHGSRHSGTTPGSRSEKNQERKASLAEGDEGSLGNAGSHGSTWG